MVVLVEEAVWWSGLSFAERKAHLNAWKTLMTHRLPELAELVSREMGKPASDAVLEAALAIDHIAWAAGNAKKVLGRHKVSSGLLMVNQSASVAFKPLGVVGVIGPWNYPVFTPMGSIAYALAAGNAVVFKPSEYTPGVGGWLVQTFQEAVGRPVLQLVTGLGETGRLPVPRRRRQARVHRLHGDRQEGDGRLRRDPDACRDRGRWQGLGDRGRRRRHRCCRGRRPLGGLRQRRPDLHRGRAGLRPREGLRRVRRVDHREGLRSGGCRGRQDRPITMPSQIGLIRSHIQDAIDRGGRAVLGGVDAVGERFVQPTILVDVATEDSLAVQEETSVPR